MKVSYDYIRKSYYLKYRVYNEEIVSYIDGNSSRDEIEEWKAKHTSIVRDMIIDWVTKDEKIKRH